MKQTILVTGCAGFIGGNFCRQFRKKYPKSIIVGLDDLSTGRKETVDKGVVFYKGSIADAKLLKKVFSKHKPDFVFHFAAQPRVSYCVEHPAETTFNNIDGTVRLLEAAKDHKVKRFIFSSTSAIYGPVKKLPVSENSNLPRPVSPYALHKYSGEWFCRLFSELYGLDTVSMRYFNVYGPGQYGDSAYSTVVSAWLENVYFPKKKKPFLEGDGRQSRDFCYVADIVQANIKAMLNKRRLNGDVCNIGSGTRIDLLTVKKLIERLTGRTIDLEKRPARLGDIRHTQASIVKARKLIGYKPSVAFERGLKETIQWFEQRKGEV